MTAYHRWKRAAAVAAALVPLGIASANASAAPVRSAITTDYTSASYLHDTLGLPRSDPDPAIDTITYGHFQWLLQQPGQYAVLIGDPATDPRFVERAQDVESAARAAGVDTVYWFNPNLSGSARVAGVRQPPLDIRDPASVALTANSQRTYGYAWQNLVSRGLGNGVSWSGSGIGGGSPTVTTQTGRPEIVNDSGAAAGQSTEVGNPDGGALYDYSETDTPGDVTDTYFLVYDKDATRGGQPQRIVSWVNLSERADSADARADVTTAIGAVGAANLDAPAQFAWWKSDVNERQAYNSSPASNGDIPVLTDADADWHVEQITFPELIHLLESDATIGRDAVLLFGGAWCPNTRPVLPAINRYARDNDVHVFNYDTVLDGGNIAGSATSGSNPFQTRNNHGSGAHPSNLYGHLFDHYIKNAKTQYTLASNTISYYPNGDTGASEIRTRRLQVPYLIGYQGRAGDGPYDGVTRQWISDLGNGSYVEYMSQWQWTNPQPNRIGYTAAPSDAAIWTTLNRQIAEFTWKTDVTTLFPNTGIVTDNGDFLGAADTARVTYTPANGGTPASVSIVANGPVAINPAALAAAEAALGDALPASAAAARTALLNAFVADADPGLIANLSTVAAAWQIANTRKTTLINAWGDGPTVRGVAGGVAAVRAAEIFFGGLPGGVVSTQTVTADPVKQGTAPTITITIANDYGRTPAGNVALVVRHGATTVHTASAAVAGNVASFTLPALAAGTYDYTLTYQGDDQIAGFVKSGSLTVTAPDPVPDTRDPGVQPPVVTPPVVDPPVAKPPVAPRPVVRKAKARKVAGAVLKAPTRTRGGVYKVTIAAPKGGAKAGGKIKVTLKKGKKTKVLTATVKRGVATVRLPKLARGTWKVKISWAGDARYRGASVAGPAIKVK